MRSSNLGVIEGFAEPELEHLVFTGEDVAALPLERGVLDDPLVEVGRADRQAIIADQRRHAHRRFAAVG